MTKYLTATLVALVSSAVFAGAQNFVVPPTATITGSPDGTVTWTGVALSTVVHYRNVDSPPVEERVSGKSGSVKLVDVAGYGGRLQLRDPNGNYAWLTPEGVRFNLVGMHLECGNRNGCALEINGTEPKSAPAAYTYPGGVYAGQAPTQQVMSTNQVVGVNTTQMAVVPTGAVATPVTMVPSPVMVAGTQSANYQRIGDRLVPIAAETRTWDPAKEAAAKKKAEEAKKAGMKSGNKTPAVAKAEQCVPGKKFTMNGKEYLCAVLATEPVTPPVAPTAAAPAAAPPAATAPAPVAPAAKKG